MATPDDTGTTPTRWDARARTQLAHALRSRVAGDDAAAKARVIWGAEGERWFTPEDPIWRVHADAAMFPGGIRALLLQSLHPLAMAGVAGHSGYKGDPWGRLQRTSHFLATTTFGTVEDAEAAIARVRGIHERVRGRDPKGRPYRAGDPRLLGWGAELASIVVEEAFWDLDGPIERITTPHVPLPSADSLEDLVLPSPERIAATIEKALQQ